jgi:hypothetical protein
MVWIGGSFLQQASPLALASGSEVLNGPQGLRIPEERRFFERAHLSLSRLDRFETWYWPAARARDL